MATKPTTEEVIRMLGDAEGDVADALLELNKLPDDYPLGGILQQKARGLGELIAHCAAELQRRLDGEEGRAERDPGHP